MPHGPAWPAPPVAVVAREIDEAVVLVVTGELGLRDVPLVLRALEKVLADRGRVLVDVSGMTVGWQPAVEVFPLALARNGGWPAARLVLFGAGAGTATVLRSVGHLRSTVHLAEDEATAIALLGMRPQRLSRRAEMPCTSEAGWWARLLVSSAYEDWELGGPELAIDLELVATELVANAVEHARTTSALDSPFAGSVLLPGVRD